MNKKYRVTVWNEGVHEQTSEAVRNVYPNGIGHQIAQHLRTQEDISSVHVSQLADPGQGLTDDILNNTDVLIWWGHMAHDAVEDANVERVCRRVLEEGMGFIALHSAHYAKPFRRLMGTGCMLKWREAGEKERLWVVSPGHPIVEGLQDYFELPQTEMYGEFFDIPEPDQLVFISWFQGGEVFRSGCCWHRGRGKVFYFRPGHETYPIYYDPNVLQVITNAIRWAAPSGAASCIQGNVQPLEPLKTT